MPSLAGKPDSKLKLSVINSSTEKLTISELLTELWALRTFAIDFYPRGLDVKEALGIERERLEGTPLIDRFSDLDFINSLATYVEAQKSEAASNIQSIYGEQIPPELFRVPALATFFPEITSFSDEHAEKTGQALINAAKLAVALGASVVEFVLGRVVERCHNQPIGYERARRLRCDYVCKSHPGDRIKRAGEVLKHVVSEIRSSAETKDVKFAAEIEPGYSFILNSQRNVGSFLDELARRRIIETVGLNLDIGHALILGDSLPEDERITAETARLWKDHILHAHVSDNIGYHFRDLVPGSFHHLYGEYPESTFRQWIKLCAECSDENKDFTKYLAVELESSSRIQWIQRSLLRLGYIIREVCK